MPLPLLIFSQSDYLILIVAINLHTHWQTVQIQISWLLQKPTDLDLHCLQRQGISGLSRTRVKIRFYTINWILKGKIPYYSKNYLLLWTPLHSLRNISALLYSFRDLINSRFGVSYSNFSFLTPTFWKVSVDKYGKSPTLSGGQHCSPIFKILVRTLSLTFFLFTLFF